MKKLLLTIMIAGTSTLAYSQFIPGNLVVVQANNDAIPPTAGDPPTLITNPAPTVSLVEYSKTGGTPVSTLAFPGTGAGRIVLANGVGSTTFEGFLRLSNDKNHITFAGFDADANTSAVNTTTSAAVKRLVVSVDKDKTVIMTPTQESNATYMRYVVAIDKDRVYTGSDAQDIRYLSLPLPASELGVKIAKPANGTVSAGIFYGKLWYANTRIAGEITVFPGLPTALATPSTKIKRAAGGFLGNITDFILFDTDGDNEADLGYIGTDGSITGSTTEDILYKVKLEDVAGTPTWVGKGSFNGPAAPNAQIGNARKVQGITGYKNAAGKYEIFYSTFSSIVTFVDDALPSATMLATPSIIASAPANSIFRGISFTPGSTDNVLPVALNSFGGKKEGDRIRLNWSTASEKNNSHFEVYRSEGKDFQRPIAIIPGAGDAQTASTYSYIDNNPLQGINYYQLNQVDFDGKSEKSEIIAVNTGLNANSFVLRRSGSELHATIFSEVSGASIIKIADIYGRLISETPVKLQKGQNSVQLKAPVVTGIYIVTLYSEGRTQSLKFRL